MRKMTVFAGKKFVVSCLLAFCLLLSGVATPDAEKRGVSLAIKDKSGQQVGLYQESHALVISASNYHNGWSKLPGVAKDIQAVTRTLRANGFYVETVLDPTSAELAAAFDSFIRRYGKKTENRLLFYFAGHGHTIKPKWGGDPTGYIVPIEAPNPNRDEVGFEDVALPMQRIEEYALKIHAKHALFLFDSCFSGSLFSINRAIPENITYKTAKPVRQFITAGSAHETVPDRSIFRRQFVAALKGEGDMDKDGFVTGAELGEFLQAKVVNYSKGSQHPQYGKIRNAYLDKGDFVFVSMTQRADPPKPPKTETPASGQVDPTVEIRFWDSVEKGGNPDLYRAYLKRFPNGIFVDIAKVKIKELTTLPSSRQGVQGPGARDSNKQAPAGWGERRLASGSEPKQKPLPKTAQLIIRSNVSGDTVTLDGKNMGPTGPDAHELTPGKYTVRVEKEGYEPFETTIRLAAGEVETVRARLESTAPNYVNWRVLKKIKAHDATDWWLSRSVQFSPDGRTLLSANATDDNLFKLWDVETGKTIRTFQGYSGRVFSVAFSPDGRTALSGSFDNTLKLWEVASGRELRTFKGHSGAVYSVAFSPDGRSILSGNNHKTLKLWEVASGREIRTLQGHSGSVWSVAFSPDGRMALSGSRDNTLKHWDLASGRELRTLEGHAGTVRSVAFSPDGRSILSGSDDDTLKIWSAASGKVIRTLKGHTSAVTSVASPRMGARHCQGVTTIPSRSGT
uniref:WD domain-containing protein, G-beta repeat-containing protein n=1 Tax=Candidatus Kentrum sp. TUN TaxID=2126343 RepID=A0A451AAW3_9GAMM|nr:MAG: WD domain-containing protein, G-beta repeat-containing protein [Candidatus Kentron sp. TUN]